MGKIVTFATNPEPASPAVYARLVGFESKRELGSITVNAIVAPPPVTVTLCAVSGAVKRTTVPVPGETVPAVVVQLALPGECVKNTCSPTPSKVRVLGPGCGWTVKLVIFSGGVGGTGFGFNHR